MSTFDTLSFRILEGQAETIDGLDGPIAGVTVGERQHEDEKRCSQLGLQRNTLLITLQCPEATKVASDVRNEFDRHVQDHRRPSLGTIRCRGNARSVRRCLLRPRASADVNTMKHLASAPAAQSNWLQTVAGRRSATVGNVDDDPRHRARTT